MLSFYKGYGIKAENGQTRIWKLGDRKTETVIDGCPLCAINNLNMNKILSVVDLPDDTPFMDMALSVEHRKAGMHITTDYEDFIYLEVPGRSLPIVFAANATMKAILDEADRHLPLNIPGVEFAEVKG